MGKMGRPSKGKWVKDKVLIIPDEEDCYIYKRPDSDIWQYFLSIPNEGEERKSTRISGSPTDINVGLKEARKIALDRKLEVMSRHQQGLKAKRIKKLFDFMDKFLEEEKKRIADYNKPGNITAETYRCKEHHLNLLKAYYKNKNTKIENLDYPFLYNYPTWRQTTTCNEPIPIPVKPPKKNHTICTELTTIRAYFDYLEREGIIARVPKFREIARERMSDNRRDYLNIKQYKQTINRVRAWGNKKNITPTQTYNRKMLYEAMLVMSNNCLRIGELRGLIWSDIEVNDNLSKEDQKIGHIIKIRKENCKTGASRSVQSPTVERINNIRLLCGIPRKPKSSWPHIPNEYLNLPVFSKYNHPDERLGMGTWNRGWQEIKSLCADEFWGNKNITWYFCRHTAISFAVGRQVPLLQLAQNAGTGIRYVESVYYHHEAESKATWDILNKNRKFKDDMNKHVNEIFIPLEEIPID